MGAFCSSCLRSDVVKYRGLRLLEAAAPKRHLPTPATMADMARKTVREKAETCGRKVRNVPASSIQRFKFDYLSSHAPSHVTDLSLRSTY